MNDYKITRQTYESFAEDFHLRWKDTNKTNSEKIESFIRCLRPGAKILDVGAGSGKDMKYLIERGFECVGIDKSKAFIEIARNEGIEIEEVDFLDMNFPEDSFDAIWSRGSLFHISKNDFRKVISKLRNFLKRDGVFYLQLIEGCFEGIDTIGNTKAKAFYSHYQKQELRSIMLENSFHFEKEIKIDGWINDYYKCLK